MAIPMNNTNIEKMRIAAEQKFRDEEERLETHIFQSYEWEMHKTANVEVLRVYHYSEIIGIHMTEDHWTAFCNDIKKAGYFVYRRWYHNGYSGETKVHEYDIFKVPLTNGQRELLCLSESWSVAWGPGRESFRGELV